MPALADLFVGVKPDMTTFKRDTQRGVDQANLPASGDKAGAGFGRRFAAGAGTAIKAGAVGITAAAAFAGVQAGKFLGSAIGSASDLAETSTKIDTLFGKSAGNIKKWAEGMAGDFGQSKQAALDGVATFALYGKQAKLTGGNLFNFSTDLSALASDMASFSNTSPEEAIEAIGAAFRGESDPIEKYGVLLNETTLKNLALKKGIIDSTSQAFTPQQRVLAVQAALYEQLGAKGSKTLGDFERTQGGLANQTRILKADFANFKTEIGQGLLPVAQRFVTQLNTKVMPALRALWATHGPAITKFLADMGTKFTDFIVKMAQTDWKNVFGDLRTTFDEIRTRAGPALTQIKEAVGPLGDAIKNDLLPAIRDFKAEGGTGLSDTITVTGTVMKFLADNIDLVADALPYLLAGLVAVKIAQIASNIAVGLSPILRLLEWRAMKKQTAAMIEQTAALTANRTAIVGATVATGGQTVAENTGTLTKIRNAAATVATTVASKAARAATIAWTSVQWLLNAALTANPIGLVIVAIAALIAIVVLAYQKNETFRRIVQAVWAGIKVAIKAVGDWFVNTLWPSLKKAYDQLSTAVQFLASLYARVWRGIYETIAAAYRLIRDNVLNPLRTFITKTIPDAFTNGVAAIGRIWGGIQELAKKPVRFVVETVINEGIIGTFNKVSGFLGGPTFGKVPMPKGFAAGGLFNGRLPGAPSPVDNLLGMTPNGPIGLAGGEYVVNAKQTAKNLPLLEAINAGMRGYADGGFIDFIRNPAGWISKRVGIGRIASKFGNNPFAKMLTGGMGKLKDILISKAKSMLVGSEASVGGGKGLGGLSLLQPGIRSVLSTLRSVFGNVPVISGFRPGARTLSGNPSYHGVGRAIDLSPVHMWARFLKAYWGTKLKELITPWNDLNINNGRPHRYTGAVWRQHNFAGGNAHIHAALAKGGLLGKVLGRISSFDSGGRWRTGTMGVNTSGRTEYVSTGDEMDEVIGLLRKLILAVDRVGKSVADNLDRTAGATLNTARRL